LLPIFERGGMILLFKSRWPICMQRS
jgi:hypothetical protein